MNDMTRQEVDSSIAAAEARSAAAFARLDERLRAYVQHTEDIVRELKITLAASVERVEASARRAEESAKRAEESAKRAEESAQRAERSAERAEESARRTEASVRRIEDAAVRASQVHFAYFLSLLAVAVGLYFGIRQSNRDVFEAFTAANRAELRAAVAVLQSAQQTPELPRKPSSPPPATLPR